MKNMKSNKEFWNALDELISSSEIIIDRPKGTVHPKYPNFIYRVNYGYLKNTTSMDGAGIETVSEFKNFLDGTGDYEGGEKYTAKKLGAFIDYNIYFDKSQYEGETDGTTRIVYHIERPDEFRGSKISVHGKNNIKVDAVEDVDFDNEKGNKNVKQLEGDGLEIKKVYDMTTTDEVEGFVCIAISETELDGGNLEESRLHNHVETSAKAEFFSNTDSIDSVK